MMPITTISDQVLEANGMSAVPSASNSAPVSITGRGPQRSETAPATGWPMPHISWATPKARLMVA